MMLVGSGSATRWVPIPDTTASSRVSWPRRRCCCPSMKGNCPFPTRIPTTASRCGVSGCRFRLLVASAPLAVSVGTGKFERCPSFSSSSRKRTWRAAVAQVGSAFLPRGDTERCRMRLHGRSRDGQTCEDLVVRFAQAHGVLGLERSEQVRLVKHMKVRAPGNRRRSKTSAPRQSAPTCEMPR